jgi:hypothetical protein
MPVGSFRPIKYCCMSNDVYFEIILLIQPQTSRWTRHGSIIPTPCHDFRLVSWRKRRLLNTAYLSSYTAGRCFRNSSSTWFLALTICRLITSIQFIYLDSIRSDRFKFQLVSFVYSLPKALYFWSLVAFFANWILVLARYTSIKISIGFLCLCCLAFVAFQQVTSGTELSYRLGCPFNLSFSFRRKDTDDESPA